MSKSTSTKMAVVSILKFSVKYTVYIQFPAPRNTTLLTSFSTSFSTYLSITPFMTTTTTLTSLSNYLYITPSMTTSKLKFVILKRLNKWKIKKKFRGGSCPGGKCTKVGGGRCHKNRGGRCHKNGGGKCPGGKCNTIVEVDDFNLSFQIPVFLLTTPSLGCQQSEGCSLLSLKIFKWFLFLLLADRSFGQFKYMSNKNGLTLLSFLAWNSSQIHFWNQIELLAEKVIAL